MSHSSSSSSNAGASTPLSSMSDAEFDPSVIVGLACRVPGASSPSQLWSNILNKKDVQRKMPEDRFNVDAFYHPDGTHKGTTNAKYGYFLDQDLGMFDAGFFNISGKEAEAMDPQQRLLLEVVYEALEDAGIPLEEINGSKTSVYCGCFTNDYNSMTTKDLEYYPKYTVTGTGNAILSNRISYFYNLHGPSVTIDTACSSSLVGFHLGNQSLRNGEADISIVVGSALHFDPNIFITMTDLGMLSTDGRCRAFDAKGSGYVRGEGVCAAVLKRKVTAEMEGDNIRAVVRATASNHDGRKQGITLPSSEAQEDLIRSTYRKFNLDPRDTGYFEAHGTGTQAGDPRETRAIGAVFAPGRERPLVVGSVKTNIGHLEGASGLAGIIKATLSLESGMIAPNMHFETPNPNIKFDEWKLQVPTQAMAFPETRDGLRRASVNSFGYGGSNAHVVLEAYQKTPLLALEAPQLPAELAAMIAERPYLLPLSSHSDKAGKLFGEKLAQYLRQHPDASVADIAYTLGIRRSMHPTRSFAIGKDHEAVLKDLQEPQAVANWTNIQDRKPRLGFVFTGQGGQWFAMGRELLEKSPMFRQTLERCDDVLQSLPDSPDWSVVSELLRSKETSRLGETRFSQPICTALQLALLDLLAEWGITPSAVVGHSSGEMAAAYAAGILSFENTIITAYYRGVYMSNGSVGAGATPGSMMAVGLTEPEAVAELEAYKGRIAIAAINSPSSITLSGDEDAILELKADLTERKVFARQLQVAQAFHSHHMFPLAPAYHNALEGCEGFRPQTPKIRMFSSVTARVADHESMGPDYWTANMTGTVRFSDALTGVLLDDDEEQNVDVLVEIGPHPALKGPAKQVVKSLELDVPYIASLTRGSPDYECLLSTAGQLFSLGYPVDLAAVNSDHMLSANYHPCQVTSAQKLKGLPSYAWDHNRYWSETRFIKDHRRRKHRHSILGAPIPGSVPSNPRWRNYLRPAELPWLSQHMIEGKVIFPAAGYISMAIEAAIRMESRPAEIKQIALRDIVVKSALTVAERDMGTEVVLELKPATISAKSTSNRWNEFVIYSFDDSNRSQEHCRGLVGLEEGTPQALVRSTSYPSFEAMRKGSDRTLAAQKYYKTLYDVGLQYGENFQLVKGNIETGFGFAIAPLGFNAGDVATHPADYSVLHPTLLDASFHPIFAAIEAVLGRPLDEPYVPTFLRSLKISGTLLKQNWEELKLSVCSNTKLPGPRVAINDVRIESDDAKELLVDMTGMELTALGADAGADAAPRSLFFRTRWERAFDFLGTNTSVPEFRSLGHAVNIFAHQHPDTQILHLTSNAEAVKDVVLHLGGSKGERRRFRNVTPYTFAVNEQPEAWEQLQSEFASLVELGEPKPAEYDLVLVDEDVHADVSEYLKPGGFVISTGRAFNSSALHSLFRSASLSAWQLSDATPAEFKQLSLIMPPKPSKRTEAIALLIETTAGCAVSRHTLADLATRPISDNIVVLSSLDDDLFFAASPGEEADYLAVQSLLTSTQKNIVWALEGAAMDSPKPEHGLIFGLARVARSENEELRLVVIDFPQAYDTDRIAHRVIQVLDPRVAEDEIAERDGCLFISRIEADDGLNAKLPRGGRRQPRLEPFGQDRRLALKIGKVGLLETLVFDDDEKLNGELAADEIEVEVKASAINFRDIAASIGIIDDYKLGDECAGVVINTGADVSDFKVGDRVIAWRPGQGAHCSVVRNPASLCYKLQGNMSFTVAASLPLILTTAYFALMDVARLQKGESVLIHSAAGGVGQMAVQLAQMVGAKVFATVGSQSKRDLLKAEFGLPDSQIFNSRDASFVDDVLAATGGRGVDVLLNSLAGPLLHASWSVIAPFGRFVEIGKRDIHENAKLDMEMFRKSISFASADLITMFEKNRALGARVFQECCRLVHDGFVKPPVSIAEFSYAEVEKAFRVLQMGKHTGKVVLVPGKTDLVPVLPPTYRNNKLFDAEKTYLLVGGLGGLGRTLAEWMVRKGARSLAFLSRSGARRPEAKSTVEWLKARGVAVSVYSADVTDAAAVKACVDAMGDKLGGVFQAAMVLQDAPLESMTYKQWQTCVYPKVQGTYNLHTATSHLPLDFFICFSSASAILGSKGQANYSAANTYLDSLMRHRRERGLKGTTMNCGMIVGVGAVAEDAALQAVMERIGYDPVNEEELLYQIEEAVIADAKSDIMTSPSSGWDEHQIITGVNLTRSDLYWSEKPLCRTLYANHDFSGAATQADAGKNVSAMIRAATDMGERCALLTEAFVEKIAAVLAVPVETIKANNPLSMYGLDSIVAVEFRKWFAKTVGVELSLFDVLGSKSIAALVSHVAGLVVADTPEKAQDSSANDSGEAVNGDGKQASAQNSATIMSRARPENLPMSTFQSRLWFAHNISEDKSILNLPVICYVKGTPSIPALRQALEEMKRRNEILRTGYFEGEDFSEQKPLESTAVDLLIQDFSSAANPQDALKAYAHSLRTAVMDIENGEVSKVALAKLGDDDFALIYVLHHIAIDRGSSEHYLDQFSAIYDAIRAGKKLAAVPAPRLQYADFTLWHNERLQSAALQADVAFWKAKFANAPAASALLPFAKCERPERNDYQRSTHTGNIGAAVLKRMKRVCAREGTTPFQFLLAAFRSFLYRYTEETDLTILMIDGNRPHPEFEEMLGFFVNMVPIRCTSDCDTSFDNMLKDVRDLTLEAMSHNSVPFDAIADAVGTEKSSSYFPLGQVVVNYQMHGKIPKKTMQDFEIYDVVSDDIPSGCELNLEALEDPATGLDLRLEYSTTLYDSADMERLFDNFLTFLTNAVKDHRQPIGEIAMCGPKELQHLRENHWATEFTEDAWAGATVLDKIFGMAETHGDANAIETSDGESITYRKLAVQARKAGFVLQRAGALPGEYVGVYARPGIEAVTAMLGALLNRCGYVAMDPDFAVDRLAFMATDSKARVIFVGKGLESQAKELASKAETSPRLINISMAASAEGTLHSSRTMPDDPFYIVYTSGSTGKPKGVVLRQRNTQQMLSTLQHDYSFTAQDKFLQQSSICFDLSVVQLFSALTAGSTVCIASASIRKDPAALAAFMQKSAVTVTYFTPTQFALLLEHASDALRSCANYRVAYFAGERLPVRVAKAFYDLATPATLYNTWSPSEVVVQTTIHKTVPPPPGAVSIPIGRPLANCRHYIVDRCLHPVPRGVIGEICVGGAQVGAGYLNRPVETAKSFVEDPFCADEDRARGWTKLFRTGDKGRFRADGELEFHGRIAGDKQVKLRGFRIDLGEVEHRLHVESSKDGLPGLVDVSVVARPVTAGADSGLTDDRQLVAFLVPKRELTAAEKQQFIHTLHEKIAAQLNDYMLPNGYQFLTQLPVTIGGKVDRQALLKGDLELMYPTATPAAEPTAAAAPAAAADDTAVETVTRIFREVLKLPADREIEPTSTFFELGGHSILLLRLQAKLKRAFDVAPPLAALFRAPTPAGIAALVSASSTSSPTATPTDAPAQPDEIDWDAETALPADRRFHPRPNARPLPRAAVSEILLTGVDSFIGVHMLAELLASQPAATIHVLGSTTRLTLPDLVAQLREYKLLDDTAVTEDELFLRTRCVPGTLAEPRFGLDDYMFRLLGQSIHAVYHLGGQISLLKSYSDLRRLNVAAAVDLVELAAAAPHQTEIHHLSTWSVPHLQTWSTSRRAADTMVAAEKTMRDVFTPQPTDDFGYFKSRWATEMVFEAAAARGFAVTIYRASAVTGNTATRVPEPAGDFVRSMAMDMVRAGVVPDLARGDRDFVLDFVPVNYLVAVLAGLGGSDAARGPAVFHIGNPSPLPLQRLPGLMGAVRGDWFAGRTVALDEWLRVMGERAGEEKRIAWEVLKGYFGVGHYMFALERTETVKAMERAGVQGVCPPVDENYLKEMWRVTPTGSF